MGKRLKGGALGDALGGGLRGGALGGGKRSECTKNPLLRGFRHDFSCKVFLKVNAYLIPELSEEVPCLRRTLCHNMLWQPTSIITRSPLKGSTCFMSLPVDSDLESQNSIDLVLPKEVMTMGCMCVINYCFIVLM